MQNVEARLVALEQAVAELRTQLESERTRIRTMRQTLQCPSCGGRRILHFRRVNESAGTQGLTALALNTQFSGWRGTQEGDPLEAFVCRQCGLLEWHATRLQNIKPDGVTVVELAHDEPAPNREPYR